VQPWPPPDDTSRRVLQREVGDDFSAVAVTVEWRAGEDVHGTTDEYARLAGVGGSYRACPLMRVLRSMSSSAPKADCIVVGRARVRVRPGDTEVFPPTITLSLDGVWTRSDADPRWRHRRPEDWAQGDQRQRLLDAIAEPALRVPSLAGDVVSTGIAKGIAEGSRNAMSAVRDVRYELEAALTSGLDPGQREGIAAPALEVILVNLIELRRAISRVRDFAREGVRTVLASHGTNQAAYYAYRVFRDPTRIIEEGDRLTEEEMLRLRWISTLDAGVRHCERLDEGLKDEVEVISGLLSASATIASAHEAQAQGEFNAVAGAVAVGFGLPALVLALYGIDQNPSPFKDLHGLLLFAPVALALVLAMAVWLRTAPSAPTSSHRTLIAVCIMAAILLLAGAGAVATWL
jgi:uncharacterized membrane protein YidH (DUF202 family)